MYCPDCQNKLVLDDTYLYIRQGGKNKIFGIGYVYRCMGDECLDGDWNGYFHTDEWFNLFYGKPFEYDYYIPDIGIPKISY